VQSSSSVPGFSNTALEFLRKTLLKVFCKRATFCYCPNSETTKRQQPLTTNQNQKMSHNFFSFFFPGVAVFKKQKRTLGFATLTVSDERFSVRRVAISVPTLSSWEVSSSLDMRARNSFPISRVFTCSVKTLKSPTTSQNTNRKKNPLRLRGRTHQNFSKCEEIARPSEMRKQQKRGILLISPSLTSSFII